VVVEVTRAEDPGPLSEQAASRASQDAEEQGWPVLGTARVPVELGRDECVTGWLRGATDRYRVRHRWMTGPGIGQAILSFTTYATVADAEADLARARSRAYRDCQEETEPDEYRNVTAAAASLLDPDPEAPGTGFVVQVLADGEWERGHEFVVVVGRMRAHVDLCACGGVSFKPQRALAVAAASAMAEVQGLPTPGG
jgi:hypothetical protein